MSTKYPGGIISKTAPTPSGSLETSTAPGIWTLEQQAYWQKLGQWPIPGNVPLYIEDYFYTYPRPAQGGSITYSLPSGVDLYNKGGIVWVKSRSAAQSHAVMNPNFKAAGGKSLQSNSTAAFDVYGTSEFAVNSGNTITMANGNINDGSYTYVDWTFVKQAKFFDIVTYTGNGSSTQAISHNLGSVPGCIIAKGTSNLTNWPVYHRSMDASPQDYYMILDGTTAKTNAVANWGNTAPTSTQFTVGGNNNINGYPYVVYLFAHDAGGFGATGSDNVISCGSFTTDGSSNFSATLGYEPQWVMIKRYNTTGNWLMFDNMRGMGVQGISQVLYADVSNAEAGPNDFMAVNSTGFNGTLGSASQSYIYIAIRRGPMKVPTLGTSVYENTTYTGNGASNRLIGSSVLMDVLLLSNRDATAAGWSSYGQMIFERLRGTDFSLGTANSSGEGGGWATYIDFDRSTGWDTGSTTSQDYLNKTSSTYVSNIFKRAPSFFDVVEYTGNGTGANNQNHNLGVTPEMCILRRRSSAANWQVVHKNNGVTATSVALNLTNATVTTSVMSDNFTSTYFKTADATCWFEASNGNGSKFVAYLFATCPGVSKVGSYTGTGAAQTIDCGFTTGVRFVMIKRTDSTGDWYYWNSASGIIPANDPYLLLNSTAAEVTGTDYIDTTSVGFDVTSTAPAALNANGGNYIFLAIA
jgi:hypothetical protein